MPYPTTEPRQPPTTIASSFLVLSTKDEFLTHPSRSLFVDTHSATGSWLEAPRDPSTRANDIRQSGWVPVASRRPV